MLLSMFLSLFQDIGVFYENRGYEQQYHMALSTIAKKPEQNLETVRLVNMYTSFTQEFFPVIESY